MRQQIDRPADCSLESAVLAQNKTVAEKAGGKVEIVEALSSCAVDSSHKRRRAVDWHPKVERMRHTGLAESYRTRVGSECLVRLEGIGGTVATDKQPLGSMRRRADVESAVTAGAPDSPVQSHSLVKLPSSRSC